jgi:hypothetical protein
MTPRPALVVALSLALVGFSAAPASAHAMRMRVLVTATDITVKTTYDGDEHDGGDVTVTVTRSDKSVIATGKIDKDGLWSIPAPPVGKYSVIAEDDFGHRAKEEIEVRSPSDTIPTEYRANEPPLGTGLGIAVGIGVIGIATLVGYWFASRKKAPLDP